MPKNWWPSQGRQRKKYKSEVESCARKNHTGMYGMQAAELQHDKREEAASGQNGD